MHKGFTFIELLVCIAIVFILAGTFGPVIANLVNGDKAVQDNGVIAPSRTVPANIMQTERAANTVPAERVIKDGGTMKPERK
jgi:prepilin-type N-terminal cleavage/methylation domain-containing protein